MVEQHLAAEGAADRQFEAAGEFLEIRHCLLIPARAAEDDHRALGCFQQLLELRDLLFSGMAFDARIGASLRCLDLFDQHVFRQRQHHRTGAAGRRDGKSAGDEFRNAAGVIDLADPFGKFGEGTSIFNFLEGFALLHVAADLADEEDHRDRILLGDMQSSRGVGGAGASRHHADARFARKPAPSVGHHRCATFLTADEDIDAALIKRVEHGEVAFARHTGNPFDAVRLQRLDDQLAAGPFCGFPGSFHRLLSSSIAFSSARISSVCSPTLGLGR
ncbi:hypothetical protein D3C73_1029780 [compost metagenome]